MAARLRRRPTKPAIRGRGRNPATTRSDFGAPPSTWRAISTKRSRQEVRLSEGRRIFITARLGKHGKSFRGGLRIACGDNSTLASGRPHKPQAAEVTLSTTETAIEAKKAT